MFFIKFCIFFILHIKTILFRLVRGKCETHEKLSNEDKYENLIRSIYSSQETPVELNIKGIIPEWINGTLYKNSAGRYRFGKNVYYHLFDGMACINKFEIRNGKVFYSNKLLDTKAMKKNLENNRLHPMLGTPDLCSSVFGRMKSFFIDEDLSLNDNVNVNIVPFGNSHQLYALSELSVIVRIDPENMSILNDGNIREHSPTFTTIAHPHTEKDGSWISMGMQPRGLRMKYNFLRFKANNKNVENVCEAAELIASIPSSHNFGISYFHSFGLTKNYIVFLEQCLVIDTRLVLTNIFINQPYSKAMKLDTTFKTKIYLINRHTGYVIPKRFYTDSQFSFHQINAYETNDEKFIHLDICSYKTKTFDVDKLKYEEFLYSENEEYALKYKPQACRIQIPLSDLDKNNETSCPMHDLCPSVNIEMPDINYSKYNSKFYNYFYGNGLTTAGITIFKINVNKHDDFIEAKIESGNTRIIPSEPTFIETPNAINEDDGIVVSIILGDKYDFLLILNAKNLEEIGRAELPETVKATYVFHGFFFDNKIKNL